MEMEKKNIAIIVLAGVLVVSGIGNLLLALPRIQLTAPSSETLIVGTGANIKDFDPLNAWDQASNDVIRQSVEGLFMIDYADPNLGRKFVLAMDEGTWNGPKTAWTVDLRQGVLFHDNTKFNATAVKWNVDRMLWFMNASGGLGDNDTICRTASLYTMTDGVTPVIKNCTINSEYSVTYYLNGPFAPFLDILTYLSAWFLSPYSTPFYEYVSLQDDMVGTGPFDFEYYIPDTEVRWSRWGRYWKTGAYFETLVYSLIDDEAARNNAMLSGTVDVCLGETESLIPRFIADPDITFEVTGAGFGYSYLGMNNHHINATMREAISYAINYTYIIEELLQGYAERAYSPLCPTWPQLPGWDQSVELDTPFYNKTHARRILVEAGMVSLSSTIQWKWDNATTDTNWAALNVETYNYSYNTDNAFRVDLRDLLTTNLDVIGITVEDAGMTWPEYLARAYGETAAGYNELELYWVGWGPDYMNPWNMLDPLFNPNSVSNSAQVNDTLVNYLLAAYITEPDTANQTWILKQIVGNLTGRIFPHVFGTHNIITEVYSADLGGYTGNTVNDFWAYPIYRKTGIVQG